MSEEHKKVPEQLGERVMPRSSKEPSSVVNSAPTGDRGVAGRKERGARPRLDPASHPEERGKDASTSSALRGFKITSLDDAIKYIPTLRGAQGGAPTLLPAAPHNARSDRPDPSSRLLIGLAVVTLLVLAASLGYAYWSGYIGDRSDSTQKAINAELEANGLTDVEVAVKHRTATASGSSDSQEARDKALAIIKKHSQIKHVFDVVEIRPTSRQSLAGAAPSFETSPRAAPEPRPTRAPADNLPSFVSGQIRPVAAPVLNPERAPAHELPQSTAESRSQPSAEPRPPESPGQPPPRASSVPTKPKASPAVKRQELTREAQIAKLQDELNNALAQAGFHDIRAKVIDNQTAELTGTAQNFEEKASAAGYVASATRMSVRNYVQVAIAEPPPAPDPLRLEGEINRALRDSGVNGVTAQIENDFSAALKGATRSSTEKEKAFNITQRFKAVRSVKDQIFVVEP